MNENVLLSKREAARSLSISVRTLDSLIAEKKMPTRRIGHRVLIARRHLDEFALGIKLSAPIPEVVLGAGKNHTNVPTAAIAEIGQELSAVDAGDQPLPPRFSEEALALHFSSLYGEDLRYVSRWGQWMKWDGTFWLKDETLQIFDLARKICREASVSCGASAVRTAEKIASKSTSAAIAGLAQADRRHAAKVELWDRDPWLLNTPTGTVDLRTGNIREHQRQDYLTKVTTAGPSGDCPQWQSFLDRVTGGNLELQSFLQRMVGYSLTGSTREHALFFLYGTGANGKSVFLSTISSLLGSYAKTAPTSLFTISTNEQHPTDVAGLRGSRFVTAVETEEGSRWAESKIKSLTGGDKITARFMRCDFFEFTPEFKLIIAGNHKPGLRSVDEAIRRRLHLLPFVVTIPENERDRELPEKLRAEFAGILAWAIEGCLAWQRGGLKPPEAVREATANYLAYEDVVGRWLEDCCITGKDYWASATTLFRAWKVWCQQDGEREGSPKRFSQLLEAHGFERARTSHAKGFKGIALREAGVADVPDCPIIPVSPAPAGTSNMGESGTSGTEGMASEREQKHGNQA